MAENFWYANLKKEVEEKIRNVPDFPKEGIQFKDITPIFKDVSTFEKLMSYYSTSLSKKGINKNKGPVKPVTYSVVKSGLIGLTRYLATYWADKNVRCNAICPGGVENNQPKEFLKLVKEKIPMGRLANSNEYQGTLLWMLSDASSYLNGAIVPVDGGRTAW